MDIKEIIEKLKNIDAKDLQNIDVDQIKDFLRRKPDVIIISVAIFVTLVISFNVLQSYGKAMKKLSWDISKMQEQVNAVEELEKLSKSNLLFIRNNFDQYTAMKGEVFTALVQALGKLEDDSILPKAPKSVQAIKDLDTFAVFYFFADYDALKETYSINDQVALKKLFGDKHIFIFCSGIDAKTKSHLKNSF